MVDWRLAQIRRPVTTHNRNCATRSYSAVYSDQCVGAVRGAVWLTTNPAYEFDKGNVTWVL